MGIVLAIISCYGTMLLVGLLSLFGISLALNENVWGGAIVGFAILAVLGVGLGYRRHRRAGPLAVAVVGFAFLLWVMLVSYSRVVEFIGFLALTAAVLWDQGAKRSLQERKG